MRQKFGHISQIRVRTNTVFGAMQNHKRVTQSWQAGVNMEKEITCKTKPGKKHAAGGHNIATTQGTSGDNP